MGGLGILSCMISSWVQDVLPRLVAIAVAVVVATQGTFQSAQAEARSDEEVEEEVPASFRLYPRCLQKAAVRKGS